MKQLKVTVNGKVFDVCVEEVSGSEPTAFVVPTASTAPATPQSNGEPINCPMPGVVLRIPVEVGQKVAKGDVLIVLEAMKMENEIFAPRDCTVVSINAANGETVDSGKVLLTIE